MSINDVSEENKIPQSAEDNLKMAEKFRRAKEMQKGYKRKYAKSHPDVIVRSTCKSFIKRCIKNGWYSKDEIAKFMEGI